MTANGESMPHNDVTNMSSTDSAIPTESSIRVLEGFKRCSESIMWSLMMDFYNEKGVTSWTKGIVPHFVTSNAFIGRSYANIIAGYISDLCRMQSTSNTNTIDKTAKFYIIEIGGGSGKLCFYVLKALERIRDRLDFPIENIVYVLSDFTESNVSFWETHADLKPFVDDGRLDFAKFEAVHDDTLHLRVSGQVLRKNDVKNPICIIGNYLIDTLCHDIFQVDEDGVLKEGLVSVGIKDGKETSDTTGVIGNIQNEYKYQPVGSNLADYYSTGAQASDQLHLSRIMDWYRSYFAPDAKPDVMAPSGASLLMPIGFLNAVRNLSDLSNGRAMIITGDKGTSNPNRFRGLSEPHIAFHGSFSLMVNFHAIKLYCMSRGGFALICEQEEASLMVNAFVLTGDEGSSATDLLTDNDIINVERQEKFRDLHNSFDDNINNFSPNDFYLLQRSLKEEVVQKPSLASIVALLKLSNWDCEVFFKFRDDILAELPRATHGMRNDLERGVRRLWDSYYHLDNDKDIAFELGRLLFGMHYFQQALEFYELSVKLFGEHHITHHNQGLCHSSLKNYDSAAICFKKSLAMKPDYEKARKWLDKVTADQMLSLD